MKPRHIAISTLFVLTAFLMVRQDIKLYAAGSDTFGLDFNAYYNGSWLVRSNKSADLYDIAKKNLDPASIEPSSDTPIVQMAQLHGQPSSIYYDYPPTLADLLLPFTFLSPAAALRIWFLLNIATLLWAGALVAGLAEIQLSKSLVPGIIFLFVFPPTISCLLCGQISIVLLLLMIAATGLYLGGRTFSSALLFALAGAMKLTPLVILIPLVVWRDWRTVRALLLWCGVILALLLAINGPEALNLYFFHELANIGKTVLDRDNRSLSTLVRILWLRSGESALSASSAWIEKILALLTLSSAAWLSRINHDEVQSIRERTEVICIFLLLSCCVSPIAWEHAYVLSIPVLVILGKRMWDSELPIWVIAGMLLFLMSWAITKIYFQLSVTTSLLGIALGMMELGRLRYERRHRRPAGVLEYSASEG